MLPGRHDKMDWADKCVNAEILLECMKVMSWGNMAEKHLLSKELLKQNFLMILTNY